MKDAAVPDPQPEFEPVLERSLGAVAADLSPHTDPARLEETARAAERRRQRRTVRAMCAAGVLFAAGVIGLGLPVRTDAGKISVGLPNTSSVPPAPTTTTPASTFVAFTTIPPTPPVTTAAPGPAPTTLAVTTVATTGSTAAPRTSAPRTTTPTTPLPTSPAPGVTAAPPPPSTTTTTPTTLPTTTTSTVATTTTLPTTTVPTTTPNTAPVVPLTAHWRSPTCGAPVFNAFYGTGEPGSVVTISGPTGSTTVTVDFRGQWGQFLVFSGITGPPAITISSSQGTLQPACGS